MTITDTATPVAIRTLADALAHQARWRPQAIALRQKRLGLWHPMSWRAVEGEVAALAAGLSARGFDTGDTLLLASHPRVEALLAALAAQWLGGTVTLVDPAQRDEVFARIVAQTDAVHVFAEDQQQVDRVLAVAGAAGRLRTLAYADARGLADYPGSYLVSYGALASVPRNAAEAPRAAAGQVAFRFLDLDHDDRVVQWPVTHEDLLQAGRELIAAEGLGAHEVALASRGFTAGGHARYLIAPWLLAGFSLNFPENLGTRDNDRRELGPTLVAGTRETYARLAALVRSRLPVRDSLAGRAMARLLDRGTASAPGLVAALARRSLRDVIGFTRIRSPLLVGPGLDDDTRAFFDALGITVRHWPERQAALPAREAAGEGACADGRSGLKVLPGLARPFDWKTA